MGENVILIGVPLLVLLITVVPAYRLGITKNLPVLIGLALVWAVVTGATYLGMANATGWDGLTYLLVLLGISAPSGVGGLLGGLVGWAKSEKAIHA